MDRAGRRPSLLALAASAVMVPAALACLAAWWPAPSRLPDVALLLWGLCYGVLKALGGRSLEWALGAIAALSITSAMVAIYTAGRLAWRTRALIKSLLEYELDRLPERLAALAAELGLSGRARAVASPHFHAFSFGWLRPQVMVSTGAVEALSGEELRALLLHEAHHVRRRDPLRGLLWSAAAAGLFWLPLFRQWAQFRALRRELKADMAAIPTLGDSRPLAGALLKALQEAEGQELTALAAFSSTAARIEQLLSPEGSVVFRPSPVDLVQSVALLLLLTALVCLLLARGA